MQIDLHRIAAVAQQDKPEAVKDSGIKGKKKEELQALVKKQQLRVKGTGKNDSVLKKDLIRVLQRGSDESGETLDERESRQKAAEEEEATSKQKVADDRARRRHDKLAKKRSRPAFYRALQNQGQPTEFDEETRQKVKGRVSKPTNGAVVEAFARSAGVSKAAAKKFAGAYWRNMFQTLAEQGSVEVPGVGRLEKRWRKPRRARNPQTGRPMDIPGRWVVRLDPNKLTRSMPSASDIDRMIERSGLKIDFEKASEMADIFQAVVEKGLRAHGKLPTGSFGKLQVKTRYATRGRDPRTGKHLVKPKSKKLKFKPSKAKFKTFFAEAEKDKDARHVKDWLEGGIMDSLQDVFMSPDPNPNQFINDVRHGEFGDALADNLSIDEIRGALKKFWPQAKAKWGKPKPEPIVGPEDLGEQGLEKAPREPLEDIVEKSQQEDPGISGPPELTQPGEGEILSGDPEIDEIFRDAFGDQAPEVFKSIQLPPKPETVPTSGEVQAFDPDAKLEPPGEGIPGKTPDEVKGKLKDNLKKKRGWLRRTWDGMTAGAKWGLAKVGTAAIRASAHFDVLAGQVAEGLPGASRMTDFLHGLALASLPTAALIKVGGFAGLSAAAGPVAMAAISGALLLAVHGGGSLMGAALGDPRSQRDVDLLGREITKQHNQLRAKGLSDADIEKRLAPMYERLRELKDKAKGDKLGAKAQAEAAKRAKKRKKLLEAKRRAEEQLAKLDSQGVVSVDLHRIAAIAATNPQTEAAVDLDRAKQIADIIANAPEGFEDRVMDLLAEKTAAVNRGEASVQDMDALAILQEAAG